MALTAEDKDNLIRELQRCYKEGHLDGYREGHQDGYAEGFTSGMQVGLEMFMAIFATDQAKSTRVH